MFALKLGTLLQKKLKCRSVEYSQLRLMWISLERGIEELELVAWHTNLLPRSSLCSITLFIIKAQRKTFKEPYVKNLLRISL
jgi:hypothetical protein